MDRKLKTYYAKLKELSLLGSTVSLLFLDQQTFLPAKGADHRSDQIGLMSSMIHKKFVDKKFGKLIYELYDNRKSFSPEDIRCIELSKRSYDQEVLVPIKFVEEFEKAKSISQATWVQAKKTNDFKLFLPHLKKMFEMTKRYTQYIQPKKDTYDVLIDMYEEGMTTKKLENILTSIKDPLKVMIKKCKTDTYNLDFPNVEKHRIEAFLKDLVTAIGFDFERGNIGAVHHPFEITMSKNDVRINTNYDNFIYAFTSIIHELGHGLYEQNIDSKFEHTNLSGGVSLGVHESQSRFLENTIGKSKAFLSFALPLIKKHFPEYEHLTLDSLYNYMNVVSPSFIRTEADELTYNMHIIIRFEIEKGILEGKYKVEDLPEIWNEKMQQYLGIVPSSLSEGCLQDIHRSDGTIGYFPTYTLGNILSAQLLNSFKKEHPNYEKEIAEGNFKSYFDWFNKTIWQHGSLHAPEKLVKMATGEALNPKYFLEYLEGKYVRKSS